MTNRDLYLESLTNKELADLCTGLVPDRRPWCVLLNSGSKFIEHDDCQKFTTCADCAEHWLNLNVN